MALELNGTTGVSAVQTGAVESGDLPAGSVIQVVQGTTTTNVTSTSNSYTDSTLEASITPTSTSSKILVTVNQHLFGFSSGTTDIRAKFALLRDTTTILQESDFNFYRIRAGLGSGELVYASYLSFGILDQPNTASNLTYKTQIGNSNSTTTGAQQLGEKSFITLMEIAG